MRIAFIHNEQKLGTGAHFINDLISTRLREEGVEVKNFYPKTPLMDAPVHLKGLANILFFYSLLENKNQILKYDLVQGTTYTPLAYLPFTIPVVSHFGSTTWGFLDAVERTRDVEPKLRNIWLELRFQNIIPELNLKTQRPLRDVAEIEKLVARDADAVIATSEIVKNNLRKAGIGAERIFVIPNAIEDYWFSGRPTFTARPSRVFLGRCGSDVFNLKLKGIDRLIDFYRSFSAYEKHTIGITNNEALVTWMDRNIPRHHFHANVRKTLIPSLIRHRAGSILLITSRYEGFSLSLIEGMSQGLIPVTYPVGIAPEIIKNGKNGFIISSQSEGKRVIAQIFSRPPAYRRRLAREARKTAQLFTSKIITRKLVNVYEQVIRVHKEDGR